MQTIEREPPSLKSYNDDRQPGGDVFGRNFKEVSRMVVLAANIPPTIGDTLLPAGEPIDRFPP